MPRAVVENKTSTTRKPRTRRTVSSASTASTTRQRKAPTRVTAKPQREKLRRPPNSWLINGAVIFTGFALSAWIGYSAPASINVNAKINQQNSEIALENEERAESGQAPVEDVQKINTNPLPNGGLVGRGPAPSRPAPAPTPVAAATTTSTSTATSTPDTNVTSTEEVSEAETEDNGAVDTVKAEVDVGSDETEVETTDTDSEEETAPEEVSEEESTPVEADPVTE